MGRVSFPLTRKGKSELGFATKPNSKLGLENIYSWQSLIRGFRVLNSSWGFNPLHPFTLIFG